MLQLRALPSVLPAIPLRLADALCSSHHVCAAAWASRPTRATSASCLERVVYARVPQTAARSFPRRCGCEQLHWCEALHALDVALWGGVDCRLTRSSKLWFCTHSTLTERFCTLQHVCAPTPLRPPLCHPRPVLQRRRARREGVYRRDKTRSRSALSRRLARVRSTSAAPILVLTNRSQEVSPEWAA